MYKNQLQELAQRSCFNLPSYTSFREGPDHAQRFKATVHFNGEIFESPQYCSTLRQAENSAAEIALNTLSNRGLSHSLAAKILDETGVYKNLLQEIAQRMGAPLPTYTTIRSNLGHQPVFTCTVELAGITFTGDYAKNKKQAEKNSAMAAWSSLKQLAKETSNSTSEPNNIDEIEQVSIARALINYRIKENIDTISSSSTPVPFAKKFYVHNRRPTSPQSSPATTSRILPFICPQPSSRTRSLAAATSGGDITMTSPLEIRSNYHRPQQRFTTTPGTTAPPPYVPMRHLNSPCYGMAPPVTIRTAVPVFSAPPLPPPPSTNTHQPSMYVPWLMQPSPVRIAPPVTIRTVMPVFASAPPIAIRTVVPVFTSPPPIRKDEPLPIKKVNIQTTAKAAIEVEDTQRLAIKEKEKSTLVLPEKETESTTKGEQETEREALENLRI